MTLDGSASSDPERAQLEYRFDFGDGTSTTGSAPSATHTYADRGRCQVTLTVVDPGDAVSRPATGVVAVGDLAPTIAITGPRRFRVGAPLTLTAAVGDREDGALTGDRVRWTVVRRHNTHTHPFLTGRAGTTLRLRGPAPESLSSTRTSWLEATVEATDSFGNVRRQTIRLRPRVVRQRFLSRPASVDITVVGVTRRAPRAVYSWWALPLALQVPRVAGPGGCLRFAGWQDGVGTWRRRARTPTRARRFVALYRTTCGR